MTVSRSTSIARAVSSAPLRYIDMVIAIRECDVEGEGPTARWKIEGERELVRVGGRWDRVKKKWDASTPTEGIVLRIHRGQSDAARWFADWLRRSRIRDWRDIPRRIWTALLIGGRRSGKTVCGLIVLAAFAVMSEGSIAWTVSPTLESGEELDREFRKLIPASWYTRREAKTGSALVYTLANGARVHMRSGHKASTLRAGRADFVLLNEGQLQDQRGFVNVRGGIVDRSGLVVVCANPPTDPRGRWVESLFNDARAGTVDAIAFELNPKDNPFITFAALEALAKEVDSKTFERDVLGLFPPIGDVVFHAWSDADNHRDPTSELVDVTNEVTKRVLGRSFPWIVGMDFQRVPACMAVVFKLFRDPSPDALPTDFVAWIVDEAALDDEADEDVLLDALEGMPTWRPGDGAPDTREQRDGYAGSSCAVIADASGAWQDAEHAPRRTSEGWLKRRRWTAIYHPDRDNDRNPLVIERVRAGNAALKTADGHRRLFVARHCARTAEALRSWPNNKHGTPDRRAPQAHLVDAATYPVFRLFGRPERRRTRPLEYRGIGTFAEADRRDPRDSPRDDRRW